MKDIESYITIAELSDISKVPVATVKYYIRENLLPKVFIQKGTRRYYTNRHIERLKVINQFKQEGMSIKEIRKIFGIIYSNNTDEEEDNSLPSQTIVKYNIIEKAMPLFRKHGYDGVTITDIANASKIGFSTFYKHFRSKKDFFIECVQKIIDDESRLLDETKTDSDVFNNETFKIGVDVFFSQYLLWVDVIKHFRAVSISKPKEFSGTFREVIKLKVELFEKRIEEAIEAGYLRKINKTLLAVMAISLLEVGSDYFSEPEYGENYIEDVLLEDTIDILLHGILKR